MPIMRIVKGDQRAQHFVKTDSESVDFTITGVKDTTLYWHVGSAYITTAIILGLILYSKWRVCDKS